MGTPVPERLADLAHQAFHDTLCPNPHPHNRIACSFVGGPVLNGVDAALASVLADLRQQVKADIDGYAEKVGPAYSQAMAGYDSGFRDGLGLALDLIDGRGANG